LLSVGEVILSSHIPDEIFKTFMHLRQAARPMFRPSGVSEEELKTVELHLKNFFRDFYYKYIYSERPERLRLCLPVVAALLDVLPNMRASGPAWSYWQFPIETLIGTLLDLIRSKSEPYAALTNAIVHKYNTELITRYAQTYVQQEWADATGKPVAPVREVPTKAYKLFEASYPPVYLLLPRIDPAHLTGLELARMREVLSLEGIEAVPNQVLAKKYFGLKLARGQVAGPTKQASRRNYRRNHLVRVLSTVEQRCRGGGVERAAATVYGAVHHYAVVYAAVKPMAVALIECVVSSADRRGTYGLREKRKGTE